MMHPKLPRAQSEDTKCLTLSFDQHIDNLEARNHDERCKIGSSNQIFKNFKITALRMHVRQKDKLLVLGLILRPQERTIISLGGGGWVSVISKRQEIFFHHRLSTCKFFSSPDCTDNSF